MERQKAQHRCFAPAVRRAKPRWGRGRIALRRSTNALGKCRNLHPRRTDVVSRGRARAGIRSGVLRREEPRRSGSGSASAARAGRSGGFRRRLSAPPHAEKQHLPV